MKTYLFSTCNREQAILDHVPIAANVKSTIFLLVSRQLGFAHKFFGVLSVFLLGFSKRFELLGDNLPLSLGTGGRGHALIIIWIVFLELIIEFFA